MAIGCEEESVEQKATATVEIPTKPTVDAPSKSRDAPNLVRLIGEEVFDTVMEELFGDPPAEVDYAGVDTVGGLKVVKVWYEGAPKPVLWTTDPLNNKPIELRSYHKTLIVEVDYGDKVEVQVIDSSGRSRRLEVDGIFVNGKPLGRLSDNKCKLGEECKVNLPVKELTCDSSRHRISFYTISERTKAENSQELEGVYIRDPLVIIVPKDNTCKANGSSSTTGSSGGTG